MLPLTLVPSGPPGSPGRSPLPSSDFPLFPNPLAPPYPSSEVLLDLRVSLVTLNVYSFGSYGFFDSWVTQTCPTVFWKFFHTFQQVWGRSRHDGSWSRVGVCGCPLLSPVFIHSEWSVPGRVLSSYIRAVTPMVSNGTH